jgi:hypothetical protein
MVRMWREAVAANLPEERKNPTAGFSKYRWPPNGKSSVGLGEYKAEELITPPRRLLFGKESKCTKFY